MTVWYFAPLDEIIVLKRGNKIERGVQGAIWSKEFKRWIADYLNLFVWNVNPSAWKRCRKLGYLIKLGNL